MWFPLLASNLVPTRTTSSCTATTPIPRQKLNNSHKLSTRNQIPPVRSRYKSLTRHHVKGVVTAVAASGPDRSQAPPHPRSAHRPGTASPPVSRPAPLKCERTRKTRIDPFNSLPRGRFRDSVRELTVIDRFCLSSPREFHKTTCALAAAREVRQ